MGSKAEKAGKTQVFDGFGASKWVGKLKKLDKPMLFDGFLASKWV